MVDKRVGVIQKQFDQKMKDMEAKNNAMLRMQMLELQRKTTTSARTYSIEKKEKNAVQEKVESKLRSEVLAKTQKNGLVAEASRVTDAVDESEMARTQPPSLNQKERLAKMAEDMKVRERSINERLETDIRRRVTKQERREQSLGAARGSLGLQNANNLDQMAQPSRGEREAEPNGGFEEPLTDIKILNVG